MQNNNNNHLTINMRLYTLQPLHGEVEPLKSMVISKVKSVSVKPPYMQPTSKKAQQQHYLKFDGDDSLAIFVGNKSFSRTYVCDVVSVSNDFASKKQLGYASFSRLIGHGKTSLPPSKYGADFPPEHWQYEPFDVVDNARRGTNARLGFFDIEE
jgi:hypothetical protein